MTINKWKQSVRDGGVLKVSTGKKFGGSVYVTELAPAITTLNALLKKHAIALKFETQDSDAGAHVIFDLISSHKLHAQNELYVTGVSTMKTATLKMPDAPTLNQQDGGTPVGGNVLRHMLMHELIHGIGPDNSEHAKSGIFIGDLVLSIGTANGKQQAANGNNSVPAFKLSNSTLEALRVAWPERLKKRRDPPFTLPLRGEGSAAWSGASRS